MTRVICVRKVRDKISQKSAFTMLELVMVIVVLGILAALALPRIERDIRSEVSDNLLSAIRHTQHLALMDNKNLPTDPSTLTRANWQRGFWHIRFGSYDGGDKWFYTISSSQDGDANVDRAETAIDPANGKYMYHLAGDATLDESDESPAIFISENFGINNVDFSQCTGKIGSVQSNNASAHVAFDYLGRPHKGIYLATNDYATVMHENCTIEFEFEDTSIDPLLITIENETGYAYIVGQDNS